VLKPQAGKQEMFLSSAADIALYGGSAGSGKTFALLMEPLRHILNPEFGTVILRRTRPQITLEGGLLDESSKKYAPLEMRLRRPDGNFVWTSPYGSTVSLDSIQYDSNRFDWQGSQIPLLCYDELTHFSSTVFWYLLSRNRSTCGVRPYIRATCNPDPDSWVAEFISWWIDQETGWPIAERAGKLRWFVRYKDKLHWYDTRHEAIEQSPDPDALPKSVTFINASIYDNPALLHADPGYLANLKALGEIDMLRLLGDPKLGGNWKVRPTAGKVFNRGWFEIVDAVPQGGEEGRGWDFAGTERTMKGDDPDFTAAVRMRKVGTTYYITDCTTMQEGPAVVEDSFRNVAIQDKQWSNAYGSLYRIRFEHEPGSAAIRDAWRLVSMMAGFDIMAVPVRSDKIMRAREFAAQARAGNIKLLRGAWNEEWLSHMHAIPDGPHDDIMDATSCIFNSLHVGEAIESGGGVW